MRAHNRSPNVEFQWTDGAWYDVSIRLVNSCLHVHYRGFSNVYDEIWRPEKFSSGEEVRSRFRLLSEQLQDEYCSQVKVGMCICASCTSDGYDNRFFDAVVQEIHHYDHHLEQCTCDFQVLWLAGPFADQRSYVSTENICLLKAGSYIETHPVLQPFATLVDNMHSRMPEYVARNFLLRRYRNRTNTREHEQVKQKAEERQMEWGSRKKRTCTRIIDPGKITGCSLEGTNLKMNKKEEKNDLPNLNLLPVQLNDTVEVTENVKAGNGWLEAEQGGQLSFSEHLILDNLEKDVSPADVLSVISIVTLEVLKVFIFPFSKFEKCTRAIVWFKDHESLMKAYAFLQNDNCCIVSPNGRPWVVLDPQDEYGVYQEPCGGLSVQTSCSTNSKDQEHMRRQKQRKTDFWSSKSIRPFFIENGWMIKVKKIEFQLLSILKLSLKI